MIVLRAIAFFILLFSLASHPPEAQAGFLNLQQVQSTAVLCGSASLLSRPMSAPLHRMVRWLQQLHL